MKRLRFPPLILAVLAVFSGVCAPARAARVALRSLKASFAEHPADLKQVIDGQDTGRAGWSVFPRTGVGHSLFVRTAEPAQAQAFEITLCFLSGVPSRYCGKFKLSYTTDARPTFKGNWRSIVPERFTATGPTLELDSEGTLVANQADTMIGDAIFQVRMLAPAEAVTGFRIDVLPFRPQPSEKPRVAWGEYRDFCLTEFRVEATRPNTTNVALGCVVRASHPLWAGLPAGVLTDGLPGSYNHPAQSGLGGAFFFELDLGVERRIDHITLRGRGDGYAVDRLSRLLVEVFAEPPGPGILPLWQGRDRADGSHPGPGQSDVLHAAQGAGSLRGRFLRLSSDSPVALSPQLAEVEVYETLSPRVVGIKADGHLLADTPGALSVPPGTKVLSVLCDVPGTGLPDEVPVRWRLRGWHEDWQITRSLSAELAGLPPGIYRFEAQVGHTDGQWDESTLAFPVTVLAHFWQTPVFYSFSTVLLLAGALVGTRHAAKQRESRRLALLEYQSALSEERSRIARDMHDEVGARLSQLALLSDLLLQEPGLPERTQRSLGELAANTRDAVNALDQVVWTVNPLHDTLSGVVDYLTHTASTYLGPLHIRCRFEMAYEWAEVQVRAQVRHELIMAFREALQNVVKHSGADTMTLQIAFDAPELVVRVLDNGRGLPANPGGLGKEGLSNMKSRLAAIGGLCTIGPRPQGGTEVELRCPLAPSAPR